jgi:hypothetical protein
VVYSLPLDSGGNTVSRRHLKKDDKETLCGLSLTQRFSKELAPDRQHVTCGACERVSRPKTAAPPASPLEAEFAAMIAPPPESMPDRDRDGPRHHRG